MAKVKIQGHASGTGILTVTAPNTSTDRTITLPDTTGTLLTADGDGSSLTGVGVAGISSSADATAITIDSSENVGIGATTLNNNFVVLDSGTEVDSGSNASNLTAVFQKSASAGTDCGVSIASGTTGNARLYLGDSGNVTVGGLDYDNNDNSLAFLANSATGMVIDNIGAVTMPLQPAFSAQLSGGFSLGSTNSLLTVPYDTERFDQNSDFNTSTYTFTAPVSGKYQFNVITRIDTVDSGATYYHVYFMTSNRSYYDIFDPRGFDQDLGYLGLTVPCLADMDANDTAVVKIYQAGGAVQTTMAGTTDSHFSGYLVC